MNKSITISVTNVQLGRKVLPVYEFPIVFQCERTLDKEIKRLYTVAVDQLRLFT